MLGIVWTVKFFALAVLSWASVVATDYEVGCTEVLADDCVPDGFSRSTHAHGEREEAKDSHSVGVSGEQCLIDTDSSEMIDVSRLGETDNGVDKDVGLSGTGSADGQLSVSSVHWVSGLESNNS
jgi:hypothetical protein